MTLLEMRHLFTNKEVLSDKWITKCLLDEAVSNESRYLYRIEVLAFIDEVIAS